MSDPHPNDTLAALDWAVNRAQEAAGEDPLARLNLAVLTALRDQARREARASGIPAPA